MGGSAKSEGRSPRCIALVGPYLSGKTTLFEAMLARTGAAGLEGASVRRNIGDATPEAHEHGMSVELNVADIDFLGDHFTIIDCPGSVEFQYDGKAALTACDAAVVVCEADEKKLPALQIVLKDLEERRIPHFLFLNKIDKVNRRIRDVLALLQPFSSLPLVLRQLPIAENGAISGFIDLALERAHVYRPHAQSEVVALPESLSSEEAEERFAMLEKLADYDDELMEQLLGDVQPPRDKVFEDLTSELKRSQICPVFFGVAEQGNGVGRLLKALRHEAPFVEETAARLGAAGSKTCAHIIKTYHTPHAGKLSLARILSGEFADGTIAYSRESDERVSGIFTLTGADVKKRGPASAGETVGLGRLESFATGDTICAQKGGGVSVKSAALPPRPVYGLAVAASERKDEIKLTAALAKIIDEDPSLSFVHDRDVGQLVLWGQGEMHLRVALKRLNRRYGVHAETRKRDIPYKETIRKGIEIRGRHKKQSGGHGQFGDVVVAIEPLPRSSGFVFSETITGGAVPRNYIPAVETGVRDYLGEGPLGFPVVDLSVCLKDGSYHTVDSSEQAFRSAGRIAMSEGMPKCAPVLLEPIMAVSILAPSEATPRINAIISSRRGAILGFDARHGWPGWDVIEAHLPESEILDMIIELRSATAGTGSFEAAFDHLTEVTGKLADQILASHSARAA